MLTNLETPHWGFCIKMTMNERSTTRGLTVILTEVRNSWGT